MSHNSSAEFYKLSTVATLSISFPLVSCNIVCSLTHSIRISSVFEIRTKTEMTQDCTREDVGGDEVRELESTLKPTLVKSKLSGIDPCDAALGQFSTPLQVVTLLLETHVYI